MKIWGIPVKLHWSIWILIAMSAVSQSWIFCMDYDWPWVRCAAMGLLTAILFVVSVFLHELAHTVAALSQGIPVERIILHFFGGGAALTKEPNRPLPAFVVAVVGIGVNAVIGIVAVFLWQRVDYPLNPVLLQVAWFNFILGSFNALPGLPLDGGHVVHAVLWYRYGDHRMATQVTVWLGRAMAVVLILFALVLFRQGSWSAVIYGANVLSIVGLIMIAQEVYMSKLRASLPKAPRRQPRQKTRGIWVAVITAVALVTIGVGIAFFFWGQDWTKMLDLVGLGGVRITQAEVLGVDAYERPVLKLSWLSRPLVSGEWFEVLLWSPSHIAEGESPYSLAVGDKTELLYGLDNLEQGTYRVAIHRRPGTAMSEGIKFEVPPSGELVKLTARDLGYGQERPSPKVYFVEFLPYEENGVRSIKLRYTFWGEPLGPKEEWWVFFSWEGGEWTFVERLGPTGVPEGEWAIEEEMYFQEGAFQLGPGESCRVGYVFVEKVVTIDYVVVGLEEASNAVKVCVPTLETLQ